MCPYHFIRDLILAGQSHLLSYLFFILLHWLLSLVDSTGDTHHVPEEVILALLRAILPG